LREAGILADPDQLTPEDKKVIESLSSAEIYCWVQIKETLDKNSVREQNAKFFI
jgi:hypothetical protein